MDSQETLDLGCDYNTHFCMVSAQAAANYWPIVMYRPKKVVLFITEPMAAAAAKLEEAIRGLGFAAVEEVAIGSGKENSIKELEDVFYDALCRCEGTDLRPVFNLTGGNKVMAFAALRAAAAADVTGFYVNVDDSSCTVFPKCDLSRGAVMSEVVVKPNLDRYLSAYGYAVIDKSPLTDLSRGEEEFVLGLLQGGEPMREAVSGLNQLVSEADERKVRMTRGLGKKREYLKNHMNYRTRQSDGAQVLACFENLLKWHAENGHLEEVDGELRFPSDEDRFFVGGGWLEQYLGGRLKSVTLPNGKRLDNAWLNVHIRTKAGADNEADAAFLVGTHLFLIECKTCVMARRKEANEKIYKLNNLTVGGLNTHLVLVSYRKLDPQARQRAEEDGIKVIEDKELNTMVKALESFIREKTQPRRA